MGAALDGRGPVSSPSYLLSLEYPIKNRCSVMASPIEVRVDVEDGIELAPVAGERASSAAESHEISSPHLESVSYLISLVRLLHKKQNLSELQSAVSDRVVEP